MEVALTLLQVLVKPVQILYKLLLKDPLNALAEVGFAEFFQMKTMALMETYILT
jgi:hypothetical protein